VWTVLTVAVTAALFGYFLFYPLSYVFQKSLFVNGEFTLVFFKGLMSDKFSSEGLRVSLLVAAWVTVLSTGLGALFALCMQRVQFPGRGLAASMMLLPMILPPFVGAIGFNTLFSRYGAVNQLLMQWGWVSASAPPDWLGNPFWGIILLETLHLFPIMYLNIAGSLSLVDPSIEEAAQGLGARWFTLLRTVTMPLILPGVFAGASIVFIWAFTDLGTPLIFNYKKIATVQIFDMVRSPDTNPRGYALVVIVLLITAAVFLAAKVLFGRRRYEMPAFGRTSASVARPNALVRWGLAAVLWGVLLMALIPHAAVAMLSVSRGWSMTVLPQQWTADAFLRVAEHPLASISIQNSLIYSGIATIFVLLLGGATAYTLARRRFPGSEVLDMCSMLPLAVPGIVLAYGYVSTFTGTVLDPFENPVILLVISYAVRRLPLVVRALYAGLQQTSITLEEASAGLGAPPAATFRTVTLPLIRPHIIGAAILAFVFSMLEVSDSLILAMQQDFYPMTKAIYVLAGRMGDGVVMAAAMGVMGIALLGLGLGLAQKLLGKGLGQMFRA
jgi:iron(III) transport system permease protein